MVTTATARPSDRRRSLLALALAALIALIAVTAACRGKGPDAEAASAPSEPRQGGTVVIGWSTDIAGVNELIVQSTNITTEVARRLFLQLLQERPDFATGPPTMAPQLARAYEWGPDRKTLTFRLRDDVVWSDGVPVTAEDVRFTWQAQTSPEVAWAFAYMKDAITDVEVIDPHTVRFHFSRVYGKQLLDVNEGVILPKHAWGKLPFARWRDGGDWFRQNLVTSGPFVLESWTPQQEIVLARNPRYYRKGFPLLDRAVIRVIPDQGSMMTQLLNGELDVATAVSPLDAERIARSDRLELVPVPFRLYVCVTWNTERDPFTDPEVRRALTMGIDRQALVDAIWGPYARVTDSPILTTVWAHDDTLRPWPYDPQEARRILAVKGFRDADGDGVLERRGKPFAFELVTNNGNPQRIDAGVMIQEQLARIGVAAEPRVLEFHTMIESTSRGDFDAAIFGYGMDTGLDLTSPFHSSTIDEDNTARYRNAEVDRLTEQVLAHPELADARPELDRIQQILHRDQPLTFLWESDRLHAVARRLRDARPNMLFSLYNLEEWWIAPGS